MNIYKLFKGLYRKCQCGCGGLVRVTDRNGKPKHVKRGHGFHVWIGGRYFVLGSWRLRLPESFRNSERQQQPYVLEHIYFFEQYHKCCLLKWGNVIHIDKNRNNNMPWNLKGVVQSKYLKAQMTGNKWAYGKHHDFSWRTCHFCYSKVTKTMYPNSHNHVKTPCLIWYHLPSDKENWYCFDCYHSFLRKLKRGDLKRGIVMWD